MLSILSDMSLVNVALVSAANTFFPPKNSCFILIVLKWDRAAVNVWVKLMTPSDKTRILRQCNAWNKSSPTNLL